MDQMNTLANVYHNQAQFAFVYIMEAHAIDEWPVPCNNADIKQHKSLTDRAAAAKRLMAEFPLNDHIHLVLDNEQDEFNCTYSSWPFRYWVIVDGVIRLKLMPVVDQVSMDPLVDWLAANI